MPSQSAFSPGSLARRGYRKVRGVGLRVRAALRPKRAADADSPETIGQWVDLMGLQLANRLSRRRVVDSSSDVVISMTTHAPRMPKAHVAIESIARGKSRPGRFMLFLDDDEFAAHLPSTLRRLQRRGLDVVLVPPGLGVHRKYFPYVTSLDSHSVPLVLCDDDVVYPDCWLADLVEKHRQFPECVVAYRTHTMGVDGAGITGYSTWIPTVDERPRFGHFGTGVSGQMFPVKHLEAIRAAGTEFLEATPTADDIWLHHLSVRNGIRTVQVTRDPQHFPFVPGTQSASLSVVNVVGGQNDVQIRRVYSADDVARLREEQDS